ncbi:serine/threonine-protein kinase [Nocardia cyriacigeorgica]|uniref:serine/threonine-protein kinase n=1 Tax=Nocardia cyriacigeorgica TaxID=135487 RepID=UPI0024590C79|nr:serine/threonine-protein kinase [Nocardia cyriacigeorgica]
MVLRLGEPFAGYRIEDVLGAGGMGVVYRAVHPRLPRTVALKVLDPAKAGRRNIQLFGREADLVCGLSHDNIVTIGDRGETDGVCWIEMEYVDGHDAAELLALEPRGLDPGRAVRIIADAAIGLDYAHRNNVVHRDIKPSNLLVTIFDGRERTLVADFGIARSLDDAATLTMADTREYTPHYVAPERFVSSVPDHRSDIYSLGASLYQLLTGSVPYPGRGNRELIHAHRHEPAPVPTALRPALPAALDAVIAKAMAKEPDLRYQSCAELAAAARAALDGVSSPQPGETAGYAVDPHAVSPSTTLPDDTTSTTRESAASTTTSAESSDPATVDSAATADATNTGAHPPTNTEETAPEPLDDAVRGAGRAESGETSHPAPGSTAGRGIARWWPVAAAVVVGAVAVGVVLFGVGSEPDAPAGSGAAVSPGSPGDAGERLSARCYWPIRLPAGAGTYVQVPSREHDRDDSLCILNQGDRGDGVAAVQRALSLCHAIPVAVNGVYDHPTMTAIRHLQQDNGVKVDGIYGPQTRTEVVEWPVFAESDGRFSGTCRRSS